MKMRDVVDAQIDARKRTATLSVRKEELSEKAVTKALKSKGYKVLSFNKAEIAAE